MCTKHLSAIDKKTWDPRWKIRISLALNLESGLQRRKTLEVPLKTRVLDDIRWHVSFFHHQDSVWRHSIQRSFLSFGVFSFLERSRIRKRGAHRLGARGESELSEPLLPFEAVHGLWKAWHGPGADGWL